MSTQVIAITGVTGHIGERLLASIVRRGNAHVRALIRRQDEMTVTDPTRVSMIEGDVREAADLRELILPECIVVNLAYLFEGSIQENVQTAVTLGDVCARAGVRQLVYCSTVGVVGRVPDAVVDENTPCNPVDDYQTAKHEIEQVLLGRFSTAFPVVILRPSIVYGPHSKRPLPMATEIQYRSRLRNYLKSCLMGYRKLNLVYVENVVAALEFLINATTNMNGEKFIVSDDEYENNNYRYTEAYLMARFRQTPYPAPRIRMPETALAAFLKAIGQSKYNPRRVYSCQKILHAGLKKPVTFEEGLTQFADWYAEQFMNRRGR